MDMDRGPDILGDQVIQPSWMANSQQFLEKLTSLFSNHKSEVNISFLVLNVTLAEPFLRLVILVQGEGLYLNLIEFCPTPITAPPFLIRGSRARRTGGPPLAGRIHFCCS